MSAATDAKRLVLASTSEGRRAMLSRLGLPFDAVRPTFDESVVPAGLAPAEVARAFAEGKARSVAPEHPGALVIGADQVLEHRGAMLRKPTTLEETVAQLAGLAGGEHALHSALVVLDVASGALSSEVVTVRLRMPAHDRELLARYVEREQTVGSVGGYHFEGRGVALFEHVEGGDDSAIVGLPLLALARMLRVLGVEPLAP